MKLTNTQKLTVSGLMTALTVVILILSNIITIGTYVIPAIAGGFLLILSYAVGKPYAWLSFIVVSVIGFLFCTDKEVILCFILFFGYYPLLKESVEKLPVKILVYIVKLGIFNGAAVCVWFLSVYLFAIPQDFELFGVNLPVLFLICLNIMFLLYDYNLTLFYRRDFLKIKSLISKLLK